MSFAVLDDLAIRYATGTLGAEARGTLLSAIAAASAHDRHHCAVLQEAAAELAAAVDPVPPPPAVRAALLRRLGTADFSVTRSDEGWHRHPVPGVSFKELRIDSVSGQATLLFKLAPATRFPPHHHSGAEQCFVLEGDLYAGGVRLGPGDFQVAAPGSDHDESYSEQGCIVMLIVAAEDYIPAPVN